MEVDEVDSAVGYGAPPLVSSRKCAFGPAPGGFGPVRCKRSQHGQSYSGRLGRAGFAADDGQGAGKREGVRPAARDSATDGAAATAKKVLEEAARDEDLHNVACNMQKQAGRIYHLYRRPDGYRYFSLLAPHEWGNEEKEGEFVGSFRLEFDRSWTDMTEAAEKDRQFAQFQHMLKAGPSMLGWRN